MKKNKQLILNKSISDMQLLKITNIFIIYAFSRLFISEKYVNETVAKLAVANKITFKYN